MLHARIKLRVHDLYVHFSNTFRGSLEKPRARGFRTGSEIRERKKRFRPHAFGAPVFAEETGNSGVHDAHVTNSDTMTRVRTK